MTDLATWVLQRADEDESLSEGARLVILGALEGDVELAEALDSHVRAPTPEADVDPAAEPARAFLQAITVAGFRGIGPETSLTLQPAPGLVVVAGRNGSGKSSFAEALEVAVCGQTYRSSKHTARWKENWRNLHSPDPCRIGIRLAAEGHGRTDVGVSWRPDAEADGFEAWTQHRGEKRTAGVASLGWSRALELYRPLLSYEELGGIFDGRPSALYDALHSYLGLEQLNEALGRVSAQVKVFREPGATLKRLTGELMPALADSDDDRAAEALVELSSKAPDLSAVAGLASGGEDASDERTRHLSTLAAVATPDAATVAEVADELEGAIDSHRTVVESVATGAVERDRLLLAALDYHARHGDGVCPVCREGTLDEAWATGVRREVDRAREDRRRLADAEARVRTGVSRARSLIGSVRVPPPPEGDGALDGHAAAYAASGRWTDAPGDDGALGHHLRSTHSDLVTAVEALKTEAGAALQDRAEAWKELAVSLGGWVASAREAEAVAERLATAATAERWLKANLHVLRNERLEPLADEAREIWALLRQESNVDLGRITLEGSKTQRRVSLRAEVDGSDAGALAVMSQGELHALALALFIPRATSEASPFGFIVLDDPIQAMDPAKVDGFVKVLERYAEQRQVIVFSHDDRLPEAVRRMGVHARILEVTRSEESQITISNSLDPVERYLDDARAVAADEDLTHADKARVIPGLCRLALEAFCRDVWFGRSLGEGAARGDVERRWREARSTRDRLLLASDRDGDWLSSWLGAPGRSWRRRGLGICTSAPHDGLRGNPRKAVADVGDLITDLKAESWARAA